MKKKALSLIELMVVILIIAILVAVVVPIMRGRIDQAKWAEGKGMMGTIATAIRTWYAEKGPDANFPTSWSQLHINDNEFKGEYFSLADFKLLKIDYEDGNKPGVKFVVLINKPNLDPPQMIYDSQQGWFRPQPAAMVPPNETPHFIAVIAVIIAVIAGIAAVASAFYVYQLSNVSGQVAHMQGDIEHLKESFNVVVKLQKEIDEIKRRLKK